MARDSPSESGWPTPPAWLRTRLVCNWASLLSRNTHIGKLAKAGIDAIDGLPGGQNLLNQPAARCNAYQRCGSNLDRAGCQRNRFNLGQVSGWPSKINCIHEPDGRLDAEPGTDRLPANSCLSGSKSTILDVYGHGFHGIARQFRQKLLEELQSNARLSLAEMGRRIGLSPTATAERMKQMEEVGILHGYTVEIDREALGLEVLAFIRMSCGGQNYHRLLDYVQTLEEVRECHHLTGGDDFLLKVTTTDMADLETLIEALLPYGNPVTSLVLSTPVERRKYAVTGKLTSVARKPPLRRR